MRSIPLTSADDRHDRPQHQTLGNILLKSDTALVIRGYQGLLCRSIFVLDANNNNQSVSYLPLPLDGKGRDGQTTSSTTTGAGVFLYVLFLSSPASFIHYTQTAISCVDRPVSSISGGSRRSRDSAIPDRMCRLIR